MSIFQTHADTHVQTNQLLGQKKKTLKTCAVILNSGFVITHLETKQIPDCNVALI